MILSIHLYQVVVPSYYFICRHHQMIMWVHVIDDHPAFSSQQGQLKDPGTSSTVRGVGLIPSEELAPET